MACIGKTEASHGWHPHTTWSSLTVPHCPSPPVSKSYLPFLRNKGTSWRVCSTTEKGSCWDRWAVVASHRKVHRSLRHSISTPTSSMHWVITLWWSRHSVLLIHTQLKWYITNSLVFWENVECTEQLNSITLVQIRRGSRCNLGKMKGDKCSSGDNMNYSCRQLGMMQQTYFPFLTTPWPTNGDKTISSAFQTSFTWIKTTPQWRYHPFMLHEHCKLTMATG